MIKRKNAARPNPWANSKPYPTPVKVRVGCKVSWNYYATEAEALDCSRAARHNAAIAWSQGFDFGYCAPGEVYQMPPGATFNGGLGSPVLEVGGLWEVCLP